MCIGLLSAVGRRRGEDEHERESVDGGAQAYVLVYDTCSSRSSPPLLLPVPLRRLQHLQKRRGKKTTRAKHFRSFNGLRSATS